LANPSVPPHGDIFHPTGSQTSFIVNSEQIASGTVVAVSVMEIDFGIASQEGAKR
jgi:hypothetical protein